MRRLALALLLAAPLAAPPAPASAALARPAAAPASAAAQRDGDLVTLDWAGLEGPVAVHRLDRPTGRPSAANRVAVAPAPGLTLAAAAWPRPFWLLEDRRGRRLVVGERAIPLEGGNNFRDLGGYHTLDGRTVAWGRLYRSGVMANLTPDDFTRLGSLGIRTVCDLRSTEERTREPVNWPPGVQPTVLATDYGLDMDALAGLFRGGPVTGPATRAAMAGFYREMPVSFAPQFRQMFRELVEGRAPLAFNCSAGKDRTGVAAALILSVLGVARETVIQDYLLSNRYFRPEMPKAAGGDPAARMLAGLPPDALQALMGVERSYIEASFAAIDETGGLDRYVTEQLGLSARDLETLRRRYLVR